LESQDFSLKKKTKDRSIWRWDEAVKERLIFFKMRSSLGGREGESIEMKKIKKDF